MHHIKKEIREEIWYNYWSEIWLSSILIVVLYKPSH